MTDNVVPFPQANLNDIPAMLRAMADGIETDRAAGDSGGDYAGVETVIVLIPVKDDWPRVFGFGDVNRNVTDPALICEMAKMWLINNLVSR